MTTPMFVLKAAGYKNYEDVNIGETTDGEKVIIGDWNHLGRSWSVVRDYTEEEQKQERELTNRVESILEKMGFTPRFDDELAWCGNCGKFAETQPGYYGDLSTPVILNDELVCMDCIKSDCKDEYLESVQDNPKQAQKYFDEKELIEAGWELIQDDYENGFHPGQNDDPKEIYKQVKDKFDHILFSIDGAGQFDTSFSVWGKND